MLNHTITKFGERLTVTFMAAQAGLQTQERVNGRRVFLSGNQARRGDRCEVEITGENPRKTVYFASVVKVIKLGDGKSSLLEKFLASFDHVNPYDNHWVSKANTRAIACARAGCESDREYLEFVMDLAEFLELEFGKSRTPVDASCLAREAEGAIEALRGPAFSCAEAYLRAGCLLSQLRNFGWYEGQENVGLGLIRKADQESDVTASVKEEILSKLIELSPNEKERCAALSRLISARESSNVASTAQRLQLSNLLADLGDSAGVRQSLEPVLWQFPQVNDDFECRTVWKNMGRSYFLEGNYDLAKKWLAWLEDLESEWYLDDKKMLAETCYQLGDFAAAARIYRSLFQALQDQEADRDY